ncbi:H-NS family nucleoid-associated regulatory protein [Paraburkholderia sp. NPDC080076]|uniref:H-NS family nucleoid-associated regulatory protein n=1 Tax=Paraburkholderia sp. NPDC080076 TaxID=3390605 RepID=UPI003CFBCECD
MSTLESLQAKIKKLEQQAEALVVKKSSDVIDKIRKLMAEHGLTTVDIGGLVGRAKKVGAKTVGNKSAAAVKYRDPKSGATWTGHGRAPSWIGNAKNRDRFLVDRGTATAKPAPAGKVKAAGNYVRGPQPALYRDPKSDATWSGRGRAPTWIAEAKDRSKFLIAGRKEGTVAATAGVVSKTKAALKKASKAVGATSTKGQPKDPQSAKYRDAKSGATWSGRGRAPAWLAGAKDRSRFLIGGSSTAADAKSTVTNAVAKKVQTAKKTAAKKAANAKVPVKKAPRKSVAVPAPVATVESGAELTT